MDNLVGYWTDGILHGGHSYWAYAFKADGTSFSEFTNFVLVSYSPIRWRAWEQKLEIFSEQTFGLDDLNTKRFSSQSAIFRACFPYKISTADVNGKPIRVLTLDLEKADANEFTKRYHPSELGLARSELKADYHPLTD